jgi:uncharacterized protein (TIGR02145 family)
MKNVILTIATVVLCALGIQAQNDTVYFMKNGIVINKQSIKTADLDSMVFYNPLSGAIVDGDGNIYTSVAIGTQEWLVENMKTTKYNDGVTSLGTDFTGTAPAYAWYNNDISNKPVYGALYNWYAVDAASSGGKNICPCGWHVPTDAEWTILENYMIENGYNYDGTTTGNKIGKALADSTSWDSSTNEGAIGNTDYPTYRNKSGFTALAAGNVYPGSVFVNLGSNGDFWSSTQYSDSWAWFRYLGSQNVFSFRNQKDKVVGISVRCVKD